MKERGLADLLRPRARNDVSRVFFPLRSNAGWFESEQARSDLEERIKQSLLVYDEVWFQDGRYLCFVGDDGFIEFMMAPDAYPGDRDGISYYRLGHPFELSVANVGEESWHPLLKGPALAAWEVDFYPILGKSGFLEDPAVTLALVDVPDREKARCKAEARQDVPRVQTENVLHGNTYYQQLVVQTYYVDSVLACALNMPIAVDPTIAQLALWKNSKITGELGLPTDRVMILNQVVKLAIPCLAGLSWEQVHSIRDSAVGRDFRKMIARIHDELTKEIPRLSNREDVKDVIARHFISELVDELRAISKTSTDVVLGIVANVMPVVGAAATAKEIWDLIRQRRSWVYLLLKCRPRTVT